MIKNILNVKTFGFGSGLLLTVVGMGVSLNASAAPLDSDSEFLPSSPVSSYLEILDNGADLGFCAEWNPEFIFRGNRCCAKNLPTKKRRRSWCAPQRAKANYCGEMTDDQQRYSEEGYAGRLEDVLSLIDAEMGLRGQQSYCSVNNGFLAWGRRVIPTQQNRIRLRAPSRCVDFGTDGLVGMTEWLGRQVATQYAAPEYAGVHFLVGDLSAPRGGCLSGRGGRRGHASHTSGLDVDYGFLSARAGRASPEGFVRDFDAKTNWWLVKKMFQNPYACVKVIFLDRKHIASLARAAAGDPLWPEYRPFIRHVKSHKNHFHVRVGEHPGQPGCEVGAQPELEAEIENAEEGSDEASEAAELLEMIGNAPKSPSVSQ